MSQESRADIPAFISLSKYIETFGYWPSHEERIKRLRAQLEDGLRIYHQDGERGMYDAFKEGKTSMGMPVSIGWDDEPYYTLSRFCVGYEEELERFQVRIEDVAGYFRQIHPSDAVTRFGWFDECGKPIRLDVDECIGEPPYIGFLKAEGFIHQRFGGLDPEITRAEIAVWLEKEIIHARNVPYSTAWRVDYPRWVDGEYQRCGDKKPTLQGLLTRLYFGPKELEELEELEEFGRWWLLSPDPERWLSRERLIERWRQRFPLDEETARALIENHLENQHSAFMGRGYLPGPMYRLTKVMACEQRHLEPVQHGGVAVGVDMDEPARKKSNAESHVSDSVFSKGALIAAIAGLVDEKVNLESLFSNAHDSGLSKCKAREGRKWHQGCVLRFLATRGYLKEEYMDRVGKVGLERFLEDALQRLSKSRKS